MEATLRMLTGNYLNFPLVKTLVREIPKKSLRSSKSTGFVVKSCNEKSIFVIHGVENVSSISQSVQNIIINHQQCNFDLNKSHKGNLKNTVDLACYQ